MESVQHSPAVAGLLQRHTHDLFLMSRNFRYKFIYEKLISSNIRLLFKNFKRTQLNISPTKTFTTEQQQTFPGQLRLSQQYLCCDSKAKLLTWVGKIIKIIDLGRKSSPRFLFPKFIATQLNIVAYNSVRKRKYTRINFSSHLFDDLKWSIQNLQQKLKMMGFGLACKTWQNLTGGQQFWNPCLKFCKIFNICGVVCQKSAKK